MSFLTAQTTVEDYFKNNFAHTAIKYENSELDTESLDEFVSVHVLNAGTERELFGATTPYIDGYMLQINIFTEKDTGKGCGLALADVLDGLFKEQVIGGYRFYVPTVDTVGMKSGDASQNFFQVAFKVDFDKFV